VGGFIFSSTESVFICNRMILGSSNDLRPLACEIEVVESLCTALLARLTPIPVAPPVGYVMIYLSRTTALEIKMLHQVSVCSS
jgi:hypothetical protein